MGVKAWNSEWRSITSLLVAFSLVPILGEKVMFCYYSSEAQYRKYPAKFFPYNIDVKLCTHVIFAFADVIDNKLEPINWNDQGRRGLYAQTVALKSKNPSLKVLLAVGGWVAGYTPFIDAVSTEAKMAEFADNVVKFVRAANMDGLDMDWEFPGSRGSPRGDKYKFTKLMKILYTRFQEEATESKKEKLLLTLATAVGTYFIHAGYETLILYEYVDYMLLMTYNFHGGWDNITAHHSTIFPSKFDDGQDRRLCQTWAVNFWLSQGVPRSKIVVGFATYGMSFTLENPLNNGLNATAKGSGNKGRYTKQEGILGYFEICENIQRRGWTSKWIEDQNVPYAYGGDQWVGYDNPKSLKLKAEKIINGLDLAGAFVWSVELDDFNGYCGDGKYPLLRTISDVIRPTTMTGTEDQRLRPPPTYPSLRCQRLGVGRHSEDSNCRWYINCLIASNGFVRTTDECPPGLSYNDTVKYCVLSPDCL